MELFTIKGVFVFLFLLILGVSAQCKYISSVVTLARYWSLKFSVLESVLFKRVCVIRITVPYIKIDKYYTSRLEYKLLITLGNVEFSTASSPTIGLVIHKLNNKSFEILFYDFACLQG